MVLMKDLKNSILSIKNDQIQDDQMGEMLAGCSKGFG